MATPPKLPKVPLPQVPEDTPASGPTIEYVGAGAEKVKFTINPKAERYIVHASGLIKEYMK